MTPIAVRRTGAGEPDLVAAITALINRAYAGPILELWTAAFDRVRPAEVAASVAAAQMFIAEREGRLVGCVQYRELDADTGWFGLLAVDPDAAGAGVGTALVEAAEAAAASTGRRWMALDLLLPASNAPHQRRLLAWYRRSGYLEIGRTDFRPPDAALGVTLRSPCVTVRYRKQLL